MAWLFRNGGDSLLAYIVKNTKIVFYWSLSSKRVLQIEIFKKKIWNMKDLPHF